MDYSLVRLSEGSLPVPAGLQVAREDEGLLISWSYDPETGYRQRNDHIMLLAYNGQHNQAIYDLCGPKRTTGKAMLYIPGNWSDVHVYTTFRQVDAGGCSNSVYLGNI